MIAVYIPYYNSSFGTIVTLAVLTPAMVLPFSGYRLICRLYLGFLQFIRSRKPIYIFTELNERALLLANDIKSRAQRCIIIFCINGKQGGIKEKELEKKAGEQSYILLPDYDCEDVYRLCRHFHRNRLYLFAIREADHENAGYIHRLSGVFGSAKKAIPISVYSFLTDKLYEEIYSRGRFSSLELHVVEESDLASRQLFGRFSLYSCVREDNTLNVCVIGYSKVAEELYRNIAYLGQGYEIRLRIIMVEEGIQDKTAPFFNRNPELLKCIEVEYIDRKPDTAAYFEYMKKQLPAMDCVIAVSGNPVNTIAEISRIKRQAGCNTTLCVYMGEAASSSLLFGTKLLSDVIPFGRKKDIYTESIIINEALDQLAKGFHNYYAQLCHDPRSWEQISLPEKQSSRALALHVQSKLYTLGLRYCLGCQVQLFEDRIREEGVLEKLAIGEHLRWNAYFFSHGWRTMELSKAEDKNKDEAMRFHCCMVDWDDLDQVSERFHKDYKEMDRHLVRNIGNVLKSVGYGVEEIDK